MKSEKEIRDKLEVLKEELSQWPRGQITRMDSTPHIIAQERVNAIEWVLGEYNEW